MFGIIGILAFLSFAWLLCKQKSAIHWRTIAIALTLQITTGAVVFGLPRGRAALAWLSNRVTDAIGAGKAGTDFLFGPLTNNQNNIGFIFAFQVLPMIVFFSSLIAVLYHIGVMHWVIRIIGGTLHTCTGTSRTESLSAAANIFVGQTEAPLVVKPYIPLMTSSELFAVMVGGLASVAGSVLAGYAAMGVEMKYLLAASFMAAPGGLLYAKLILPETQPPASLTSIQSTKNQDQPENLIDAAALGASTGLQLALNVGAMVLAFVGLIALANLLLSGLCSSLSLPPLNFQTLLGWLFAPVAWLAGIPSHEMLQGGSLIGQKLVLNELVAYIEFTSIQHTLSPKSQAICSVALCGFANFSSIAILIGGLGGMAPSRRGEIATLGIRALTAATLANLTSAAIVGLFS